MLRSYRPVLPNPFKEGEHGKGNAGDDADGGGDPDGVTAPRRALLYTATTDNPNFYLSSVEEAATTIASAVGPSGPNRDYLFSLSEYLQRVSLRLFVVCLFLFAVEVSIDREVNNIGRWLLSPGDAM